MDRAQGELILANRAAKERYKKPPIPLPTQEKLIIVQTPRPPLPLTPMEAITAAISPRKQTVSVPPPAAVSTPEVPSVKPSKPKPEDANDRSIEIECYYEALTNAWSDGALTRNEERQLKELRTVLEISDDEHAQFEREIKYICYKNALIQHLSNDSKTTPDKKSLADLQKAFHISQEEHMQIQDQGMHLEDQKQSDEIPTIDDDVRWI